MYKYIAFFLTLILVLTSCLQNQETRFTEEALSESLESVTGQELNLKEILEKHRGKKVIIEFWASWCSDCIKSMPKVADFQESHPEVQFIMISVDDDKSRWKSGLSKYIDKFNIQGEQYHLPSGWDNDDHNALLDFINLDWIPRYMLIGKDGLIQVYYAQSITDKTISENL